MSCSVLCCRGDSVEPTIGWRRCASRGSSIFGTLKTRLVLPKFQGIPVARSGERTTTRIYDGCCRNPKCGASWEGYALGEVTRHVGADRSECFYRATHAGAELDLLIVRGRLRLGFECKRTTSPSVTPSMRTALADLRLKRLDVIYPGTRTFLLAEGIRAVGLSNLLNDVAALGES